MTMPTDESQNARPQRRLAAILAADIAGYSALMGADEARTVRDLKAHQAVLLPMISEHGGRIIDTAGDGVLAEFGSVVNAVECAIAIQRTMTERNVSVDQSRQMQFRIGVNIGDVIYDDARIYGDGINIAARLEGIAEPGGICISGKVYEEIKGRVDMACRDIGEQQLKNIAQPVRTYRVNPSRATVASVPAAALLLAERPSIAVLPFDNMSGDPEQEYFSDGLTEDIITALSKHRWMDVVARNTTFAYKGQSPDVRQLAAALGADYVVEGSVRRSGQRVRVTAQLIDTSTGSHVWAERYDRNVEEIFDLQDEITETIVGRVEPEIGTAIRQRVHRAPRRDLHAWECYQLGIFNFYKFTSEGNQEAQRLLQRSRELDPSYVEAHAWWAYATILGMVYWDTEPSPALMDEALAACRQGLALDSQNAMLFMLTGRVQLARREYRNALADNETAIRLNPTLAPAYCGLGDSLAYEGRYAEAISQFRKAVAMSPNHPQLWAFLSYGALAFLFNHEFEEALKWAERASDIPNCQYWATAHAAVALAYLNRPDEARRKVEQLLVERPAFSRAFAEKKLFYLKRPEQIRLYLDGLEKAGVQAK